MFGLFFCLLNHLQGPAKLVGFTRAPAPPFTREKETLFSNGKGRENHPHVSRLIVLQKAVCKHEIETQQNQTFVISHRCPLGTERRGWAFRTIQSEIRAGLRLDKGLSSIMGKPDLFSSGRTVAS